MLSTIFSVTSVILLLFTPGARACVPSVTIDGGCSLDAGPNVVMQYKLRDAGVEFAINARTNGYVALSIVPTGQTASIPADAVVGQVSPEGTQYFAAYQFNGEGPSDVIASGVPLKDVAVTESDDRTTLRFWRPLDAGRFPIDPEHVTMYVTYGATAGQSMKSEKIRLEADLNEGLLIQDAPSVDAPSAEAPGSDAPSPDAPSPGAPSAPGPDAEGSSPSGPGPISPESPQAPAPESPTPPESSSSLRAVAALASAVAVLSALLV